MGWNLIVTNDDGIVDKEEFDEDELGTLDDMLTGLFITSLDGIKSIVIEKKEWKEESIGE